MSRFLAERCHFTAAVILTFLSSIRQLRNGDFLWHLAIGQTALTTGEIPARDTFSHTMSGAPVLVHAPLYQTILALVFNADGWAGLALLRACLIVLLAVLLWAVLRTVGGRSARLSWLAFVLIWFAQPQLPLHGQLFAFVLFMATLLLGLRVTVARDANPRAEALCAGGIVFLWAFLHGSYPLGLLLILMMGFSSRRNRFSLVSLCIGIVLAVSAALWWIEPQLIENVVRHSGSDTLLSRFGYWKPLWSAPVSSPFEVWILLNLGLLVAFTVFLLTRPGARRSTPLFPALVAILVLVLGLRSMRFYPLILFGFGLLLVLRLGKWADRPWSRIQSAGAVAYLLISVALGFPEAVREAGWTLDDRTVPVKCAAYLQQAALSGEMFNSYNFGSYFVFAFRGHPRVFVDPRASVLYSDEFLGRFLRAYREPAVFEELVRAHNVQTTALVSRSEWTRALLTHLDRDPKWRRVYEDGLCVVHRRNGSPPFSQEIPPAR